MRGHEFWGLLFADVYQIRAVLRITEIAGLGKVAKAEAAAPKAAKAAPKADTEVAGVAPAALDAPQGAADDLKKISGVGPALEKKLNNLGIYYYSQITAWTPENIAYVDDQLSFHGRIERDDWVAQATSLASSAS